VSTHLKGLGYFVTIQGCPVFADIAAYWAIVINDAHAAVSSIYRGQDAAKILHAHGKHTQQELIDLGYPADAVNKSSHCLRSDSLSRWGVPPTGDLAWWQQCADLKISDVGRCFASARTHGWELWHPYPAGTGEDQHVGFRHRPTPNSVKDRARLIRLRLTLPRR
jgi:hypothetical protein